MMDAHYKIGDLVYLSHPHHPSIVSKITKVTKSYFEVAQYARFSLINGKAYGTTVGASYGYWHARVIDQKEAKSLEIIQKKNTLKEFYCKLDDLLDKFPISKGFAFPPIKEQILKEIDLVEDSHQKHLQGE